MGRHIQELGAVSRADLTEYMRILLAAFDEHSASKAKRKAANTAAEAAEKIDKGTPLFPDDF